jgi:serine/threonine-protein kinase SRPK3
MFLKPSHETFRLHTADLHPNNLAFVIPSLHTLTEDELFEKLGTPRTGPITRKDGEPLEANMPPYLVSPASFRVSLSAAPHIKIIDFGEAFPSTDVPETLHTPVYLRAPEVIFGDKLDFRVDLWSAGCLVSIPSDYIRPNQS